ncbi:MAG TPA: uracil-DNA glycosylase [Cytophagaceae bacterium]|jgi:uracil-DNA glycosylase
MNIKIESSWKEKLIDQFEKEYFKTLIQFVKEDYSSQTVYPPGPKIFNAFNKCPFEKVKVVLIGQDPYHGPEQANGLCFSVSEGIPKPPSLKNIFKEVNKDLGQPIPDSGNLERWAEQGVFLLNATLTVRANSPGSHQKKGWEEFTDAVIEKLSNEKKHVVYLLWGAYAQKKGSIINPEQNLILKAAHPSPFAADKGFFGSKHFSKTNEYLINNGLEPIVW